MIVFEGSVGTVYNTVPHDWLRIAENMRESDVRELRDGAGVTPADALATSFAKSSRCWTIKIGDEPVAMFGVAPWPHMQGFAAVWYLATDRWDREGRRDMLKFSSYFIRTMQDDYDYIGNFVDCRNTMSIKWLQKLGFTRGAEVRNTASGLPFVFMVRRNPGV